jgi:hypothetical protein
MATTSMPVLRTRWVSWLVAAAKRLTPQDMIHSWTVTGVREVNLLHKERQNFPFYLRHVPLAASAQTVQQYWPHCPL